MASVTISYLKIILDRLNSLVNLNGEKEVTSEGCEFRRSGRDIPKTLERGLN